MDETDNPSPEDGTTGDATPDDTAAHDTTHDTTAHDTVEDTTADPQLPTGDGPTDRSAPHGPTEDGPVDRSTPDELEIDLTDGHPREPAPDATDARRGDRRTGDRRTDDLEIDPADDRRIGDRRLGERRADVPYDDLDDDEVRAAAARHARHARWADRFTLILFAAVGAVAALVIAGNVSAPIGPFDTTLSARPAVGGHTKVELSPLGSLAMDTHRGPLALNLRVDELRVDEARAIANDPTQIDDLEQSLTDDTSEAVRRLAVRVGLAMVLGATGLATLRRPKIRSALTGALTGVVMFGLAGAMTLATWEPRALAEPKYSGLLSMAPQAVGDARDVADRFSEYRTQLTALVQNVAILYETAEGLQSFQPDPTTIRVLHVSDLHLNPEAFDLIEQLVIQFDITVVVDTGDINDWGTVFETSFVERIGDLDVPYLYIRGNHDSSITAAAVADQPNAHVLDGTRYNIQGVSFWGIGDPRFTPDRSDDNRPDAEDDGDVIDRFSNKVLDELGEDGPGTVDVVMVHDPAAAAQLEDTVPLVLAGHTHEPDERELGSTTLLVEGSTGGAGLRALQREEAEPLTTSVLYLDAETNRLQAYDRISVGGLGTGTASIERHVVADRTEEPVPTTPTTAE